MTAQETLSQVFEFSASAWRNETDRALIPQPHRWLMEHPDAWHYARFDAPPTGAQRVVLYRGEAGTGKTTQLDYDASRLARDAKNIVVRLDFSQASLTSCPLSELPKRAWEQIAGQIEPTIEQLGLTIQYRAQMYNIFMRTHGGSRFARLRAVFGFNGERDFSQMTPEQLANAEPIRRALRKIEKQTGPMLALSAVQHIPGRRTIICVDNVDHLGLERVEVIMDLLTIGIERDTLAFIAVRPEHFHLLKAFKHERSVTQRNFQVDDELIFKIAEVRCHGAIEFAKANAPDQAREIEAYAKRMIRLCDDIHGDPHSVALLNEWHNGDLRQMLGFLSQTSWSSYNRDSQASVRSLLYRSLVKEALPPSLLEIFNPVSIPSSSSSHPFTLLKLRVLLYLQHHQADGPTPVDHVIASFVDSFGISPVAVGEAVSQLAVEPPASGSLIRLVDEGDKPYVLLLPAGSVFVTHILFSCDFLSWLYDRSTSDSLPKVDEDIFNYRQVKLDKAASILAFRLVRMFEKEHPYVLPGRHATPADSQRLKQYQRMFGFSPGSWFVSQMLDELTDYQRQRDLNDAILKLARTRVAEMCRKLDQIFNMT